MSGEAHHTCKARLRGCFALSVVGIASAAAAAAWFVLPGPGPLHDAVRALRWQAVVYGQDLEVRRNIAISAADGVRLATDVYLPRDRRHKLSSLLVRLPYGKSTYGGALQWVQVFARRGYAVVVQDMRGRFASEGVFTPYDHAVSDGSITLDWIARQDWSNGRVATVGCSALGEHQAILAKALHPNHTALVVEAGGGAIGLGGPSRGYFGFYEGGIPTLASAFGWFVTSGGKTPDAMHGGIVDAARLSDLPSGSLVARHRPTPTDFDDFIARFEDAAYWERLGYLSPADRFAAPALHLNTWHDFGVQATFEIAALMRANATTEAARANQPVVIGPGNHCEFTQAFATGRVGDLPVATHAALDFDRLKSRWLDHWLRDGPAPALAPYTFYVLGADRWQTSNSWPPRGLHSRTVYLAGGGVLTYVPPPAATASFTYDPDAPTPSIGGAICCTGAADLQPGPRDQRPLSGRSDVLSFASQPLREALTIIGDIKAQVTLSTDVPDTDLVLTVLDIRKDGTMLPIQQVARRLRYRNGFDLPQWLPLGERVSVSLTFPPIAYEVSAGSRLGLHIASSSFPRLERNMNSGGDNHLQTVPRVAHTKIHLGTQPAASLLVLPVHERRVPGG